ncbi:MAG: ABC transporter ATP-binding protein [Rhodocyclaceae bacterium]|nr:ABC transporter ATP-binding protein [Rhodocyclaceae bacterium]
MLSVEALGKSYKIYASPRARLRALLTGQGRHTVKWALEDVSFALERGHCLGVIGPNGAGKSTLLKLITGTLRPTTGRVTKSGRLAAILELGAGFHPEFTGRANLYFAGSLIGIAQEDMRRLEPAIVAFAELGDAIHRPVKTYSSGMVVRLAFSLATAVEPDILIIDEALAVGDQRFQKKCSERIAHFRRSGCTILFCSHSQYHIRQLCDAALWLDHGRMQAFGETEDVLSAYESHVRMLESESEREATDAVTSEATPLSAGGRRAELASMSVAELEPGMPGLLRSTDLCVTVTARAAAGERPNFGVMLEQNKGIGIASVTTHHDGAVAREVAPGVWEARVTFPELPLHSGEYVLSAYLFDADGVLVYDEWLHHTVFRWIYPAKTPGLVRLPHHWS